MPRQLRRTATCLAMLAATVSGAPAPAAAAQPARFTLDIDDTFPSRTSEECGFDILLHVEGRIVFTDYVNHDGEITRSLVTYPNLFYTFSNADTGKSVTSRSPNPEHYEWSADGSLTLKVTGLVLHLVVPGAGVQAARAGRFLIMIDADGNVTESEPVGRTDDYHAVLCEILAP